MKVLGQGSHETGAIGIVAGQFSIPVHDGVDGADKTRLVGKLIDHGADPLLVGDGDVHPGDCEGAQRQDGLGKTGGGNRERQVDGVDPHSCEGLVVHRRRQGMGHRKTENPIDPGVAVDLCHRTFPFPGISDPPWRYSRYSIILVFFSISLARSTSWAIAAWRSSREWKRVSSRSRLTKKRTIFSS